MSNPVLADGFALASKTMEICGKATRVDNELAETLSQIGWVKATKADTEAFSSIFVDGIAAATGGDRSTEISWPKQMRDAAQLATALLNASEKAPAILAFLSRDQRDSALALFEDSKEPGVLRCLYSGSSDAELLATLDVVAAMDERTGLVQATPGIQIITIDSIERNRRSSFQIARFLDPMEEEFGRHARVEIGFSFYSAPMQ